MDYLLETARALNLSKTTVYKALTHNKFISYDTQKLVFCTFRESAGAMYCPSDLVRTDPIPDEVYDEVKRRWENHLPG